MTKEKTNFLKDYKRLCEKYKMFVDACGCCSSPWITEERYPGLFKKTLDGHIKHLKDY